MNIFIDFHHSDLFKSFKLLFEGRLGHKVFRPIGNEWFTEGFWKIAEPYGNNQGTVDQFLKPYSTPSDGTRPLNEQLDDCLTFEQFKNHSIDVIIATIPAHIQAYSRLIREHKPSAKLIYHIGNIGWHNDIPWKEVNNIMASVKAFPVKESKNVVFYRQEFDLNIFQPLSGVEISDLIVSFVNCLPQPHKYEELKKLLPDYEFGAFGAACPDGVINDLSTIAAIMHTAKFGYHNKPEGDGFGHIIHNWMAIGKPIIVNLNDYKDKLAGELLEDGVTCIDLDLGVENTANRIKNMSDLEYIDMINNVRRKFKEVVNFGEDAYNVRNFLNNLI